MFKLDFFCRSSLMGTTLRAAPSKSYAFSTNYHACIAMPTWPRCASPILCWPWPPYNLLLRSCLTFDFFRRISLMGTTLRAWPRCASPILCWPWPPYNLLLRSCLTFDFFRRISLMDTTLRAAPSKSYAVSTNYHT